MSLSADMGKQEGNHTTAWVCPGRPDPALKRHGWELCRCSLAWWHIPAILPSGDRDRAFLHLAGQPVWLNQWVPDSMALYCQKGVVVRSLRPSPNANPSVCDETSDNGRALGSCHKCKGFTLTSVAEVPDGSLHKWSKIDIYSFKDVYRIVGLQYPLPKPLNAQVSG